MPVHDWTRVEAGIFHHFHHRWITAISDALNSGLFPGEYYALAEHFASGLGPDVLTLAGPSNGTAGSGRRTGSNGDGVGLLLAPPKARVTAETSMEFYHRKQKIVTVRHISDDDVVAVVEIVSPGNKSGRRPLRDFVEKAAWLIGNKIHLLIIDLQPPTKRDPHGIHGVIWEEMTGEEATTPVDKPLTLAAYESSIAVRAYVERLSVGDALADMPLFLESYKCVEVPLEATYATAYSFVPKRWQRVLEDVAAD